MKALKALAWSTAVLAGITAYIAVILASNLSEPRFLWLLSLALLFAVISKLFFNQLAYHRLIDKLRSQWGVKQLDRKHDFSKIRRLLSVFPYSPSTFLVDDRTWQDLDMDHIYRRMDRTITFYGQQRLYQLLRNPLFDNHDLTKRAARIELFQNNPYLREKVQVMLSKIGDDDHTGLVDLLWDPSPIWYSRFHWGLSLMFFIALLSPLIFLVSITHGVLSILAIFIINSFIYYKVHKRISSNFLSIRMLAKLIHWGGKISTVQAPQLNEILIELKTAVNRVHSFLNVTSGIRIGVVNPADPILDALLQYINIYFLLEVKGFYRAVKMINEHRTSFQEIFTIIGEIDACLAVASYRDSLQYCCQPQFVEDELQGCSLYHPLLETPVANTITIGDKGILITGSNMSGKSTFLRTVGLNALCGQTIYTCFAKDYRAPFVKVLTTIGRSDNIIEGKSYYLEEAKSILRIIQATEQDENVKSLVILDEIYRGTNSEERIHAGYNVLKYLAKNNCFVLVATHDLELTQMLEKYYVNYHFREQIGDYGLEFDYRLNPGPSQTRNAIALLKILGYPQEITK